MKKFYAGVVLSKDELEESGSDKIELKYYKLSKRAGKQLFRKTSLYGIEIDMEQYYGGKRIREKKGIYNLTNDKGVIEHLIQVLIENKVTPISLHDVIQEVL